jgi:hypothetical protein
MNFGEQAPGAFIKQLERTASLIPNPTGALKCTRNVNLPGSGHLEIAPGYKPDLLEGFNIDPWKDTKVPSRDPRRAKVDIRKAMKWRRQTRKRDKQNHITLT